MVHEDFFGAPLFFISICAEFLFESLEYIGVDMKKISIFAKNIGF